MEKLVQKEVILERLSHIIYENLGIDEVQEGTSLEIADDIDMDEIRYEISIEFNIPPLSKNLVFNTVGEIVDYLLSEED